MNGGKKEVQNHQLENLQQCVWATGFADESTLMLSSPGPNRSNPSAASGRLLLPYGDLYHPDAQLRLQSRVAGITCTLDSDFQLMGVPLCCQTTSVSVDGSKALTSLSSRRGGVKSSIWSLMPPDWKHGLRGTQIESTALRNTGKRRTGFSSSQRSYHPALQGH